MNVQTVITYLILGAAVVYLLRRWRVWPKSKASNDCGCGNSSCH